MTRGGAERVTRAEVYAALPPSLRARNPHLAPTRAPDLRADASTRRLASLPASVLALNPQLAPVLRDAPAPARPTWKTDVVADARCSADGAVVILRGLVLCSERNRREPHEALRGVRAKWQKGVVRAAVAGIEPPRVTDGRRWEVRFTRGAPQEPDSDSLPIFFKAVRDAVAAWLGVDDGPRGPVVWTYRHEHAARADRYVRFDVEPLPPEAP